MNNFDVLYFATTVFNFAITVLINVGPALIIRYLIKKQRFSVKKYAIISCAVIAIAAWTIAYAIAFSDIGSGLVPMGYAEVIFAFVNYQILKPRDIAATNSPEPLAHKELLQKTTTVPPQTMDPTMQAYADVILSEPPDSMSNMPENKKFRLRVSIVINMILSIALVIAIVFCVSIQSDLEDAGQQISELEEKYDRAVFSRNSMQERYETEISELHQRYNPSSIDFEEELRKLHEKDRAEIDKWNANNEQQLDYDRNPI